MDCLTNARLKMDDWGLKTGDRMSSDSSASYP